MPEGRYFFIQSELNGLVLDVEGGSHDPGTRIITWPKKDGEEANQLWHVDHVTKTIRSKMHGLCLDINEDNRLVVCEYDSDRDNQKWKIDGDFIRNDDEESRVLDVAAENRDPGAGICAWSEHGNDNQRWSFHHVEADYFYIRSEMHHKVVDIKKRSPEPGKKVVMWEKEEGEDSQLWYYNKDGYLTNKLNDLSIDASEGNKARMQPFEHQSDQCWVIYDGRICQECNKDMALDIKEAAEKDGAKLLCYPWHGGDNQRWYIEHA